MSQPQRSRVALIPPPALFVVAFALGLALDRLVPALVFSSPLLRGVGWVLLVIGVIVGPGSALHFALRRTTLIPHGQPSKLVTEGAYRFTRNPMYVGLALAYLGLALVWGAAGAIALLAVPLAIIDRAVIPMEEARLGATFGEAYSDYSKRVRRWL